MPFLAPPIEPSLAAAVRHHNGLLAAEGCALRLEIRGGRLGLRGPLPDRLGGGQARVQRLSLGLTASPTGLTIALERLARLRQELASGRFQWHEWKRASSSAVEGGGGRWWIDCRGPGVSAPGRTTRSV